MRARGAVLPACVDLGLLLLSLVAALAVGCGGSSTERGSTAVRELRRLTPLTAGQPILVFVYTDR